MSKSKDDIILQQLDVIRTLTENNLSRMNTDFWGTPKPSAPKGESSKPEVPKAAAPSAQSAENAPPPPEKIENLVTELEGYIGLANIKQEVKNLINMVKIHKLREENGLPTEELSLHMVFFRQPRHRQNHRCPHHGPDLPQSWHPFKRAVGRSGP